jgi:Aminoglycoside N3''-acetyltransferase
MPQKDSLITDLKNIGVKKGDIIYVHSSMKSIGWIDDGIDTLTEAFLEVLGDEGTLAVPTHTLAFIDRGVPPFDPKETPPGLGAYPEAVWRHPLSKRSAHATHSSAAIGAKADFLTENHDPTNAMGYDSPLHRMVRSNGKILLIGVTHTSNTTVHLAESLSAPYCKLHYDSSWGDTTHTKLPDGTVKTYKQTEYPGCSSNFNQIEKHLIDADLIKFGKIGNADSRLIDAAGMVEIVCEMIKNQPDILLCDSPKCPCCPPRRKLIKEIKECQ